MRATSSRGLSAQDWILLATQALVEAGTEALTIEALCRRASRTKGSFYAHFASHDAFLDRLAAHWKEIATSAIIRAVEEVGTPAAGLALLNDLAMQVDPRLDQGMRKLGSRNTAIAAAIAEVDTLRISCLEQLYQAALAHYSPEEARVLAVIEYAAFVGFQQMPQFHDAGELRQLNKTFMRLIVRSA